MKPKTKIIISGQPRSGTSLDMSIIQELGVSIAGEKEWEGKTPKRDERSKYLNPEGFWELPGIVAHGINENNIDRVDGDAVKIITAGLLRTDKKLINKVIFCARDPREIAVSSRKLVSQIEVATKDDWKYVPEVMPPDFKRYIQDVGRFLLSVDFWDKILVVDYGDLITNPTQQVKRIANFLEVPFKQSAADLVQQKLYRSRTDIEKDPLADRIYQSLLLKNLSSDLEKEIKDLFEKSRIENTSWLDDTEFETWVIGGWDLHKSLISNNKGVRDKLQYTASINRLPLNCEHYKLSEEEYTVERIDQLGPIIRTKVDCFFLDQLLTRERCYNCWQSEMRKEVEENRVMTSG